MLHKVTCNVIGFINQIKFWRSAKSKCRYPHREWLHLFFPLPNFDRSLDCYYWDSIPGVWEGGSLILVLIFLVRKAQEHYIIYQMLREGNQVKRELEESRCRYMKCKITLEETLPSLKEMVDKFDGGSSSPKIKSEWLDLQKAPRGLFREL